LTRNEPEFLLQTIHSIKQNTEYPHQIIVCDNASNHNHQIKLLDELVKEDIKIFRNKSNRWVLGLNPALNWISENKDSFDSEFCVVTDGDIEFPHSSGDGCWLTCLVQKMSENSFIGKLGLSISLKEISGRDEFNGIVESERRYQNAVLCPGVYLAPVDTTAAIYRYECMVTKELRFFPGHNSYVRPDLYVGRSQQFTARHLGWEKYGQKQEFNLNTRSKIICFTIFGAHVDPLEMAKAPLWLKIFRMFAHPLMKAVWSARLFFAWIAYISRCKIIYQNRQYFESRFSMRAN
jgi:glycosyltransferase involved in cell wall biosynthesis